MLLLNGDCLEVMKTLPDKSIDLFLCDLPYGCLKQEKGASNSGCDWDIKIDLDLFWIQVERLMKNDHTPIIHFCNTRFGYDLIKSKEKWFRYDLVWNKSNGVGFLSANKMPLKSHENIYVFAKKGATYYRKDIEGNFPETIKEGHKRSKNQNVYGSAYKDISTSNKGRRCVKSVIDVANKKARSNHPTQKPVELYEWLIERYSKDGDTILDPTAGSFTSIFTAEKMNRKAIGIEKDEKFYNRAKEESVATLSQKTESCLQ